jgi:hypothetical protein
VIVACHDRGLGHGGQRERLHAVSEAGSGSAVVVEVRQDDRCGGGRVEDIANAVASDALDEILEGDRSRCDPFIVALADGLHPLLCRRSSGSRP